MLTVFHKSYASLLRSSESCDFCRLVRAQVKDFNDDDEWGSREVGADNFEFILTGIDNIDGIHVLRRKKTYRLEHSILTSVAGIGFHLDDGTMNPLSSIIQGRKVPLSPQSPLLLGKIKEWAKQCAEQHEHSTHSPTLLPTRVLDVHNCAQEVVLFISNNTEGLYTALSHCWGSSKTLTLSSKTCEKLSRGIPMGELPQSFKDAVWLTNQLGIRYLWIDSLCIFQDDPQDWLKESPRMDSVYGHAFLTIAASRAVNSNHGFLGERRREYVPLTLQTDQVAGEVLAFKIPPEHARQTDMIVELRDEPLSSRAWTLQERCLSRRTLHFCQDMILFECENGVMTEDNYSLTSSYRLKDYSTPASQQGCRQDWRQIVEEYTRRSLTMEDDKLPAIGGLAAQFSLDSIIKGEASVSGNRYLAGIWYDDIIQGLCWSTSGKSARPRNYQAPTWSWASVRGQIHNAAAHNFSSAVELVTVEDAHVDLETPGNLYGKVTSGWLHLKALRFELLYDRDEQQFTVRERDLEFSVDVDWDEDVGHLLDVNLSTHRSSRPVGISLMPLCFLRETAEYALNASADDTAGPFFLLLRAATNPPHSFAGMPVFQRIGFGMAGPIIDDHIIERYRRLGWDEQIIKYVTDSMAKGHLEDIIILHAHLTGSISVQTLHEIWQKKTAAEGVTSLEDPLIALPQDMVNFDVYRFFPLFDNYIYGLCNDIDAVRYATRQVLRDFEKDGVRYLELRTTPREVAGSMSKDTYVSAVLDCIEHFGREKMSTYLILSVDRRNTPAQAMEAVDLAIRHKHRGVVGVDLCGNPLKGDVATFRDAFEKAKANGLKVTLHFAEVPESSTTEELRTLLSYQPDRLGHVVNVPDDIKEEIASRGLGLELCLSCNVHAKLISGGFADHHFGYWKDKGCPISLCTDDVGVFRSPVSNEYLLAAEHFNLSREELVQISRRAIDSIFSTDVEKDRMRKLVSEFEATVSSA
ncbi:subtilisin-like serine protease [Paramyrothecium foliicola]|nr:subtilisin-like serine protease [Paramyrothecium foliicola]